MWKWMDLFLKKNHLLRCWNWLSLPNWIETLTLSLSLKLPWEIWSLDSFFEVSPPEVVLYLYLYLYLCSVYSRSAIWSCMEYCCHVSADAPSCYLEFLDKLQKQICGNVCPSLAASLELLTQHWNVASLSLLYTYYFGRCSSELAKLVLLPYSRGMSTR